MVQEDRDADVIAGQGELAIAISLTTRVLSVIARYHH